MDETLAAVRAFLESQSTMALATVSEEGLPGVAPVYYVSEGLALYWLSSPASRHSAALRARGRAAAAVYPAVWQWSAIRGVQVEGDTAPVRGAERRRILRLYRSRFQLPAELEAAVAAGTLYVLRPRRVRWLDNRVGFGYRAEVRLDAAGAPEEEAT
ncbi:MAG: pyridoxamine 5'-phosphate oxidase family protein [Chthonomonadales bacterium]|nr:pyridoxamine 5'-phosphate oxidase family protein [Chthonomonadales bacterium]